MPKFSPVCKFPDSDNFVDFEEMDTGKKKTVE